jgi:signal transduction histidine kinase
VSGPTPGLRARIRAWWPLTDDPGPIAIQGVFTVLVVADLAIRYANHSFPGLVSWPGATLGLLLVTGVLALAGSWERLPPHAAALLPVLDIGVVGLARLPDGGVGGVGMLIVLPAYWLGRMLRRRGAVVTLVAGLALVTLPAALVVESGPATLIRSLLVPLVATWAAWAIAVTTDLAERQQASATRHRQELTDALEVIDHQRRVADAILDTVDVGLVLLDRHGTYQSINRRHVDFMRLAYPEGHAGHAGQLGLVYNEDGSTLLTREQMPTYRAARGEEFDDCRIWVGDDPLTWRALSVSARTVRDDDGGFAGAALAYKDVTDFMRALRVKDEFVASVSHELRTPLTSMRGYVDLLMERDDLPEDARHQLGVVGRNTGRLGRLVADLLHSAQSDIGPMHVVRAPGDLALVVREALAAAEPVAATSGVALEAHVPDNLDYRMDRDRMRQVVDNLISNAIKYTSPGGRVQVSLEVDGERVELCVEDDGIGINAQDRDRLFSRFFRSREAEERSIQGVGLGLSITRSIVESHGGRIEVDSEVGRGSVFRVRLPVAG